MSEKAPRSLEERTEVDFDLVRSKLQKDVDAEREEQAMAVYEGRRSDAKNASARARRRQHRLDQAEALQSELEGFLGGQSQEADSIAPEQLGGVFEGDVFYNDANQTVVSIGETRTIGSDEVVRVVTEKKLASGKTKKLVREMPRADIPEYIDSLEADLVEPGYDRVYAAENTSEYEEVLLPEEQAELDALSPENDPPATYEKGQTVTVKRTSGAIENDWTVLSISRADDGSRWYRVVKTDSEGTLLHKLVSEQALEQASEQADLADDLDDSVFKADSAERMPLADDSQEAERGEAPKFNKNERVSVVLEDGTVEDDWYVYDEKIINGVRWYQLAKKDTDNNVFTKVVSEPELEQWNPNGGIPAAMTPEATDDAASEGEPAVEASPAEQEANRASVLDRVRNWWADRKAQAAAVATVTALNAANRAQQGNQNQEGNEKKRRWVVPAVALGILAVGSLAAWKYGIQPRMNGEAAQAAGDAATGAAAGAGKHAHKLSQAQEQLLNAHGKYPYGHYEQVYGDQAGVQIEKAVDKARKAGVKIVEHGQRGSTGWWIEYKDKSGHMVSSTKRVMRMLVTGHV